MLECFDFIFSMISGIFSGNIEIERKQKYKSIYFLIYFEDTSDSGYGYGYQYGGGGFDGRPPIYGRPGLGFGRPGGFGTYGENCSIEKKKNSIV